jgi:uncharacterized membrane protein
MKTTLLYFLKSQLGILSMGLIFYLTNQLEDRSSVIIGLEVFVLLLSFNKYRKFRIHRNKNNYK